MAITDIVIACSEIKLCRHCLLSASQQVLSLFATDVIKLGQRLLADRVRLLILQFTSKHATTVKRVDCEWALPVRR